ncbi:response regulator [Candidatus Magnetobacterium casense]|uniref:response regulator n=1 Tax=Candidatus Magnetobacterium casense TaxID=1455061 RepID=UPI00058C7117|nr:response regulator [Candidatus Magnetobacterium casensis]
MVDMVLLVEDEPKTGEMLKKALEYEIKDISVTWAQDGKAAMGEMKRGKFDLIILDLRLPDFEGAELLKMIRKVDKYAEVIVYTNYQDPTVMKELIKNRIGAYINKGPESDVWEIVEWAKDYLEPFTEQEREELLAALPAGMFQEARRRDGDL